MQAFPLIRTRWSNEHVMAAVFGVVSLYHLPQWIANPWNILNFVAIVVVGLAVDVLLNFLRYKRPVCAVSAAVTAAMISILTPDIVLGGQLLGVLVGLVIGKHLAGGTGKNLLNPAIVGVFCIALFWDVQLSFTPSIFLLPALVLSPLLARHRPFAAVGCMIGMVAALVWRQELTVFNFVAYGVVFWSCLVLTDPVTVTCRPVAGGVAGLVLGVIAVYAQGSALPVALAIFGVNLYSFALEHWLPHKVRINRHYHLKPVIPFSPESTRFSDLTNAKAVPLDDKFDPAPAEILERIKTNEVFGLGGGGFSTYEKIRTVLRADVSAKHLIVNGVECDPGLIHDKWLLRRHPLEIYRGIKLLSKCVNFESVTLAVKEAEGLQFPADLRIYQVPSTYPAGAEKLLIEEILHTRYAPAVIPATAGVLVLNVQTVFAIYEAVYGNKRADTRFLTLANLSDCSGQVVRVRLGMNIAEIVSELSSQYGPIYCGGGMMQAHASFDEETVDRSVNFIATGEQPYFKESPLCSKCGKCTALCPAGLQVHRIAELVEREEFLQVRTYEPEKCLQCGLCSYVCGAGKNLAARTKVAKQYAQGNTPHN